MNYIDIIKKMDDHKFRMFYGDFKVIHAEYVKIQTYSTKECREKDAMLIGRYDRNLQLALQPKKNGITWNRNPWVNVKNICLLDAEIAEEARKRGIA